MKILFFDCETTGTNPELHDITQFAAIVEIDGVVKEEVNWRCQPSHWENVDPKALEVTGVSLEELRELETPDKMAKKIKRLFDKYIDKFDKNDKFFPAGHNVTFDLNFLQNFWKQHIDQYGTGSYQNWKALDSLIFINFLMGSGRVKESTIKDRKLSTIAEWAGVELDAHDALSDIRATRIIINRMLASLQKK